MKTPLFRQEVLESAGTRHFGTIVLINGLSVKVVSLVAVCAAALVVGVFVGLTYQRKVEITGVLSPEAGLQRIVSLQSGTILKCNVREGQHVHNGDVLFEVNGTVSSSTGGDTGQAITNTLRARRESLATSRQQQTLQFEQREQALLTRISSLGQQAGKDDAQLALQQSSVEIAESAFKRQTDLQTQGFVSSANVDISKGELLRQRQLALNLESEKASHSRELATAEADLRDVRSASQLSQQATDRETSLIDQQLVESEGRRQTVVKAPEDGVITAINGEVGQVVAVNQSLATLVPENSPLLAELYAPSRAAGFVKVGMDVLLDYQAFPYQKFGHQHGRVLEISNAAMRPEEMLLPGSALAANGEGVYRIRVKLDQQSVQAYGEGKPLRSGMAVDARVVLDERTIAEWALEPLFSIKGRL